MIEKVKRFFKKFSWQSFNIISLCVAAILLWVVVVGNQGFGGLLARWGSLSPKWMLAALACMAGYWLLEGIEVHWLVGCLYRGVSLRSNLRTAMIGQLYSALTPFSTGGQPIQIIYMQRDGLDTGGGAAVLTYKTILYQVGQMLFAMLAVTSSYGLFREKVPGFGWMSWVGFLINLLVTGGMLLLAFSPRVTTMLYRGVIRVLHALRLVRDVETATAKAQLQFDIYHKSARLFERSKRQVLRTMVATCLQMLMLYSVPVMIAYAFGYRNVDILRVIAAVAFVTMVSAYVPLPGGSGAAEGSFVLFFGIFFQASDLLVALLLWRLITYYAGIVVGALVMMISKKRQRACVRIVD